MSVHTNVLPNGDLEISLVPGEDYDWDHLMRHGSDDALHELLAHERGYGWDVLSDGDIPGALTSAPMISDDVSVEDDGTKVIYGTVWWFPRYALEDPVETLRDKGSVVFDLGHRPGELVPPEFQVTADKGRYGSAQVVCKRCGATSSGGVYCPSGCGRI